MLKRAKRLEAVRGFGIDRVAAAAETTPVPRADWPVLRLENLDTDLPLPPEALAVTRAALETQAANSWLPFTGDLELRAAISDFTAERTGRRYDPERGSVTSAAPASLRSSHMTRPRRQPARTGEPRRQSRRPMPTMADA